MKYMSAQSLQKKQTLPRIILLRISIIVLQKIKWVLSLQYSNFTIYTLYDHLLKQPIY